MQEIKKSVDRLKLIRNNDNGWGDVQGVETKIVTTGEAVLGIIVSGEPDFEFINKTLEYLSDAIANKKCHKISQYCWATLPLLLANPLKFKKSILESIDFLLDNQLIEGGWGYLGKNYSNIPEVYTTTLALRLLCCFQKSEFGIEKEKRDQIDKSIKKGIDWLLSVQNNDDGWGFGKGESNAAATAHAIITLLDFSEQKNQPKVKNGKDWLLKNQKENGEFLNASENIEIKGNLIRFTHFSTPWAIIALLKIGMNVTDSILQKSMKYMIELQEMNGDYKPSHESLPFIWAASNAILAFSSAKEYFHPINDVAHLTNQIEVLQEKLNTLNMPDEKPQRGPLKPTSIIEYYAGIISEAVNRIKNEPFLFVIVLALILITVVVKGTNLVSFDLNLIVIIIAILAFVALLLYWKRAS